MNPSPEQTAPSAGFANVPIRSRQNDEKLVVCKFCSGTNLRKNGRNKSGKRTQVYYCKDCGKDFTPVEPASLFVIDPLKEYEKQCWDCRRLGIEPGVGRSSYKLNFEQITQPWMNSTVKQHIKIALASLTFSSVQEKLSSLRRLSSYFQEYYPNIKPSEIDRSVLINFAGLLGGTSLSVGSRNKTLHTAKLYFEDCYQNQWLEVPRYLVRSEDLGRMPKRLPRYIPDEVIEQLNEHLTDLAPPVARMVIVLQECGMRISELVNLKLDCLLQDKAGDWFMKYYQFKMKKEITIPLSREVVMTIQQQVEYIKEHLPSDWEYMFCANGGMKRPGFNPVPKIMTRKILADYLNYLAKTQNICDGTGKIWHFQSHQFRHTVGTRMINNGVPQHIIQRFLGHESPAMTATYATIHDQTMKQEIAKFQDRVVNIAGQIVAANDVEADDETLQWFKKNVYAQALPNGSCALPIIIKGCPHANACLTCTHFRTTADYLADHRQQLAQTQKLIDKAKVNGWHRQVEMNERIKVNLETIIASLEEARI